MKEIHSRDYYELNSEVPVRVDDFYQLDKDRQALEAYLEDVATKIKKFESILDKVVWLIENRYYVNFLEMYSKTFIESIYRQIQRQNFRFSSFMSAFKFYNDYALKTVDGEWFLENYDDRILSVALYLGDGNFDEASHIADVLIKQFYQPATPTFLNAGKHHRGELVSCFLLTMEDSLNSITETISTAMQLSKIGGGLAVCLSNLRCQGESIRCIKNTAKGIVPVMKLLEDSFNYVDQMGQRKGAGAAYLSVFHADIIEFLDTKKINADEKSRIQTLSIGVVLPDKFFELVRENKTMSLFSPHSVFCATGKMFDDINMTQMYDQLILNPHIERIEINPRNLLLQIAKTQYESGYPYLIFIDNANKVNPLKNIGDIHMSNLCTEIFQIQKSSYISDDHENDQIGYDISCVLGSLNIVNVMDSVQQGGDFAEIIEYAMLALTKVTNKSSIKNARSIRRANELFHSVGLGVMNLQGFFVKNNIEYGSVEARDFANVFFMLLNYYSLKSSSKIAKDYGKTFDGFERSAYKDGSYFNQYIESDIVPETEKICKVFCNIFIPKVTDWKELKKFIEQYGLYHSYRLAIAPTQSISYIQNATPSTMPMMSHVESRTYGNSTTYYPAPYLSPDNIINYQLAHNISMYDLLDLTAVIQKHIDQGISTTLYVNSNASTKDLMMYYIYAHKIGLKSLYYTRTKNLAVEECTVCSI